MWVDYKTEVLKARFGWEQFFFLKPSSFHERPNVLNIWLVMLDHRYFLLTKDIEKSEYVMKKACHKGRRGSLPTLIARPGVGEVYDETHISRLPLFIPWFQMWHAVKYEEKPRVEWSWHHFLLRTFGRRHICSFLSYPRPSPGSLHWKSVWG